MATTRMTRHIEAPRSAVYRALLDADGGTTLTGTHEDLPPGVAPADNELGWRISIDKLAALVEGRE